MRESEDLNILNTGATGKVGGSHAIYVSNPQAVAEIIEEAATGVQKPKRKRPNKS